jgi:hypothetical protein
MAGKPRWGLIILGIVIFVVVVGAALVGIGGYIFFHQFSLQTVTTSAPEGEFAKVEAQFAGQLPLIEIRPGEEASPIVHRETDHPGQAPLSNMHILAWNSREKKLVRFTMPFWLVRLGGNKPMHFSAGSTEWFESNDIRLTSGDIERHGPGLLVNMTTRRGERIIVWTD